MNEFSEDKLKELKAVFDLYDTDKDNFINVEEFDNALKCLGYNINKYEVQENFNEFSIDKKVISIEGFEKYLRKRTIEFDIENELMDVFKSLNKSDNGKIYAKDMKYLLLTLGEKLSDEEVDELIKVIDVSGEGAITYKDFISLLMMK